MNWLGITEVMAKFPSRVLEEEDGTIYQGWKFGDKYAVQKTYPDTDGTMISVRTEKPVAWSEIKTAAYVEIDYLAKGYNS